MAIVTDVKPERASHVLRYGAKIGKHEFPVSFERVRVAMLPERYPADGKSVGIEILGNAATDGEDLFWRTEPRICDGSSTAFYAHGLPAGKLRTCPYSASGLSHY